MAGRSKAAPPAPCREPGGGGEIEGGAVSGHFPAVLGRHLLPELPVDPAGAPPRLTPSHCAAAFPEAEKAAYAECLSEWLRRDPGIASDTAALSALRELSIEEALMRRLLLSAKLDGDAWGKASMRRARLRAEISSSRKNRQDPPPRPEIGVSAPSDVDDDFPMAPKMAAAG